MGSSSLAQTVISTNAEILCLPPSQPTNPERERQLEGSNEARKALGACRLCAYLCGTPQRLLHDKVEHTRLATKATYRTCLTVALNALLTCPPCTSLICESLDRWVVERPEQLAPTWGK